LQALRAVEDAQNSVNGEKAEYSKLVRVQRDIRGCDSAFISEGRRVVKDGQALWHHPNPACAAADQPVRQEGRLSLHLLSDILLIGRQVGDPGLGEGPAFELHCAIPVSELPHARVGRSMV